VSGTVADVVNARRVRLVAWSGLALCAALLIGSYVAIAVYSSKFWLWSVIVHESGDRTLLRTVFFYEHAARELPLDVLLGISVAAGVLFALPGSDRPRSSAGAFLGWLVATLAATVVVIVGGTVWTGGMATLGENLLQFPTRPGAPLVWGGHWRYHLLSHVALMLCSFGLAAPLLLLTGKRAGGRSGMRTLTWGIGGLLLLAMVFGPGADSFRDPVFLGHQARELVTHSLTSVPLAWGLCLWLGRDLWSDRLDGVVSLAWPLMAAGAGGAVGVFLILASLLTSAASQGQSDSLAVLVFPHFFEHTFSYVVSALTAGVTFEMARRPGGRSSATDVSPENDGS
jgi:hypothetical protein